MLLSLKKINFETFLINFLFSFIPISFIGGNLILNLNILLFIIITIYFHGKDALKINLNSIDKLIIVFFGYVLFAGLLNNFFFKDSKIFPDNAIIIKTILYLRFLFLYFAIRILIEKDVLNFKSFLTFCSICSYFVCIDLIYQFNVGNDIFGYTSNDPRRLAGPFGDENIAGSYLQRFAIFTFFLILLFLDYKNKIYLALTLLATFILIFTSLIIAGNRIPLILFLTLIVCVFSFNKTMRKYLIAFVAFASLIFAISWSVNPNIKNHFSHFNHKVTEFVDFFSTVIIKNKKSVMKDLPDNVKGQYEITVNGKVIQIPNVYIKEFNSGYQTWKQNKFIGGGIKSFRKNCTHSGKSLNILNCSTHPHNYYLEILSELGIIGFVLLIFIFSKVFYDILIKRYMSDYRFKKNDIIIPFMFLFFLEIFPIRTTGSFFTTGNATYIFLVMAITIALSQSNDKKI
tara:strand:- start:211 stop:1584 length:1374 start_codon:yes stop_codon:yes gene_type:complete